MSKIVVLISGRGSNLIAIHKNILNSEIGCVISNNTDAQGIKYARNVGIQTHIIPHTNYNCREDFDKSLAVLIDRYQPKLIVLAGFMRILTRWFIQRYTQQIVNIHPSLLPSFTGINATRQAFQARIKITGVTVHYVSEQLDCGPIIAQGTVPILSTDNEHTLATRVLQLEHKIYPFIINKLLRNKVHMDMTGLVVVENEPDDNKSLGIFANNIFF